MKLNPPGRRAVTIRVSLENGRPWGAPEEVMSEDYPTDRVNVEEVLQALSAIASRHSLNYKQTTRGDLTIVTLTAEQPMLSDAPELTAASTLRETIHKEVGEAFARAARS